MLREDYTFDIVSSLLKELEKEIGKLGLLRKDESAILHNLSTMRTYIEVSCDRRNQEHDAAKNLEKF